jgi:Cu(I)/Ag(I) efflux system membrane fusion protein
VKVQVQNYRVSGVLTIPAEAVLWTGERSVVYVQDANDASGLRFGLREVSLGEKLDGRYEVLEGLEAGERVVSKGTFSVDAAAQLAGKASMMNSARDLLNYEAIEELPEWTDVKEQSSSGLKKEVYALVEAYLKLKDALVEARPAEAANAALEMEKLRSTILVSEEQKEVQENWEQLNAVITSSTQGITRETNLDKQRQEFIMLSNSMIALVSSIGFEGATLYLQNCPMANNDQGADWLSLEENIRNPYFGSLMMTCGTVENIFK